MSEIRKTLVFGGGALVLALLAFVTTPRFKTPDAFQDQGEPFFPEFTDPNVATTLEVIEFDEETGSARPFKVTFKEGKWTIPSHHDYPADGKDRLAKTAAGVIDIKKDDFRSDNVADHEACGVIDPLDEKAVSQEGRGRRVTIKGANDRILADFIVGKQPEGRKGFRFVRIPGQKRVYLARMDIDLSTKFEDWIEKDLLQVEKNKIDQVTLKDYSINERSRRVEQRDVVILDKLDDTWKANRMSSNQEIDSAKMSSLLSAVDSLSIVGVRPKPQGLSASLRRVESGFRISQAVLLSLQSKGYYFTQDGQLLSNEGELQVHTSEGIKYILRFGEIVYGRGEAVTAGSDSNGNSSSGPGENRYLFISTEFDPRIFPEPKTPRNTDFLNKEENQWTDSDKKNKELHDKHAEWKEKVEKGRKLSADLNARFAAWYYVISADSFEKIHLKRKDLVKQKSTE